MPEPHAMEAVDRRAFKPGGKHRAETPMALVLEVEREALKLVEQQ